MYMYIYLIFILYFFLNNTFHETSKTHPCIPILSQNGATLHPSVALMHSVNPHCLTLSFHYKWVFIGYGGKTAHIRSYFITLIQASPAADRRVIWRKKDTHFCPRKSQGALSLPLFNGSIAIPTPSCLRALFPYGYCAIIYPCRCLADINAYFPCQPSKLN